MGVTPLKTSPLRIAELLQTTYLLLVVVSTFPVNLLELRYGYSSEFLVDQCLESALHGTDHRWCFWTDQISILARAGKAAFREGGFLVF